MSARGASTRGTSDSWSGGWRSRHMPHSHALVTQQSSKPRTATNPITAGWTWQKMPRQVASTSSRWLSAIGRCDWCDLDWDLFGWALQSRHLSACYKYRVNYLRLQTWNLQWNPCIFAPFYNDWFGAHLCNALFPGGCGSGNVNDINQKFFIFHQAFLRNTSTKKTTRVRLYPNQSTQKISENAHCIYTLSLIELTSLLEV